MAILDKSHPSTRWLETTVGQRLLADTRPAVEDMVRRCHGDTLLWAGAPHDSTEALQRCMVRHRFRLTQDGEAAGEPASRSEIVPITSNLHELPLPNNAMDAMVLHYALEPLSDPRGALREAARVLHPGGRLVLAGLNPWSLLGLRRAYAKVGPDAFSGVRFLNPLRVLDWLAVLGLEVDRPVRYLSYGLPFRRQEREGVRSRWVLKEHPRVPLADSYVLTAVKQAVGMPPLRRAAPDPMGKLAGVGGYPRFSARLIHVDFRGEGR